MGKIIIFIDEDWGQGPLGYTRKRMLVALWSVAKTRGIDIILINRPFCMLTGWFKKRNVNSIKKQFGVTEEGINILYPISLHERILAWFPCLKPVALCLLRKTLHKHGLTDPQWCVLFHPYQSYLLGLYPGAKKIYECYDDYTNLHSDKPEKHLLENEISLIRDSDLVITTSEELRKDRLKYKQSVICLSNGVDFDMYDVCSVAIDELTDNNIKIGFVGKLNSKIDFLLLNKMATIRPEWRFYMIGPWDEKREVVSGAMESFKLKNIIYTGSVKYEDLPKWTNGFNACIIPYKCNKNTYGIFPLKYYEYLAAGKPVISTRFATFGGKEEVYLSDPTPDQFVRVIEKAMKEDSSILKRARKETARHHSWTSRAERVLTILKDMT